MSQPVRPRRYLRPLLALAAFTAAAAPPPSLAQNAAFQDYFFSVCGSATGALAARCAQTDAGLGNLSGDSESSLNPSQALSGTDTAFLAAQQRVQELGETLAQKRDGEESGPRVSIGPWSLLINAHTTDVEADRDANRELERGYDFEETGLDLGVDYRVNDRFVVGAFLHWTESDLTFDQEADGANFSPSGNAGNIDGSSLGATLFFSSMLGESAYIDGSVGQTQLDFDVTRNAIFQESNRVVPQVNSRTAAQTDSEQTVATLNAGFYHRAGGWDLSPFIGVSYIATSVDSYAETDMSNTGLAMAFSTADRDRVFGHVGVTASRPISMDGWVLVPQLRVEYVEEFSSDDASATARYLQDSAGSLFTLDGLGDDASRVDWAVGVSGIFPNGWVPFIEYQQSSGLGDLDRFSIVAGLRVAL